jgi:hypothetical protein
MLTRFIEGAVAIGVVPLLVLFAAVALVVWFVSQLDRSGPPRLLDRLRLVFSGLAAEHGMAAFIRRGKEKWVFAPAVSSIAAPTRSEINAGTILTVPGTTSQLVAFAGFATDIADADTSDLSSTQDTAIPGTTPVATPTLTFKDDDSSTTIRAALAEGTSGFIIRMPYGDVPTKRCSVWPVRVGSQNDGVLSRGAAPRGGGRP